MEFLFDLLLTAFFSLLFAFFLSKLFSPSNSSSTSVPTSSDDAADVIAGGVRSTEEDLPEESRAPRLREGEDLQEEKIIEVDKVVEKETEREFLAEEGRSELSDSVGIGGGKVAMCEGTEERCDDFVRDVQFEKEKVIDRGLVQKYESFELETSISSDKEKESCASKVGDGKVSQSSDLTFLQDQSFVLQEESLREVELSEPEVKKDRDNLCEVEGSIDKMPREVGVPTEEESCLKEEHEFKIASQGSVIVHDEIPQEAAVPVEVVKAEDEKHNLCEVEGPISKTSTEGDSHLKKLTVPQEISVEAIESSEQKKGAEAIESSEQKKGEEQQEEDNLSKAEGPTIKMTQLVGVGKKEKEKAFIEEEGWEGIERTDIEKQFAVATGYATSEYGTDALSKLNNEVQLQLYGLHKVATEGPCYESHPLALRASTRAKWHAWQKLGNMNPEAAMEEYMTLLSKNVPDWFEQPVRDIVHKESDQLTIESGSCIEGSAAFGSVTSLSPEKGTESHASIQ